MSEFDVTESGTPTGGETLAPAQPVATPQAPFTAPGQTAAPQAPATGAPQEGWVPSYRLREARESAVRQANEDRAREVAAIRAEADRYRTQLHSLVGVTQPQNPEVDAIKAQFSQLFPGLAKMEARANDLMGVVDRAGDLESQTSHYWQSYGRQTMDTLFTKASETLGGPLTDEGKRHLHSSFLGWVQSSPELQNRYANDPSIVNDFWRAFSTTFIDPVRRTAAAGITGRIPGALPQDTPSGAPRATPAPQPSNLDERASNAWLMYKQSANPNITR